MKMARERQSLSHTQTQFSSIRRLIGVIVMVELTMELKPLVLTGVRVQRSNMTATDRASKYFVSESSSQCT